MRKYIELVTGVPTGSEMPLTSCVNGLLGDNLVDDSVWVVKTHHPNPIMPGNNDFTANKCIVTVRNPFDVIMSCYNFFHS